MDGQLKKLTQIINSILLIGSMAVSGLLLVGYSYNMGALDGSGLSSSALAFSFYDSIAAAFYMAIVALAEMIKHYHWIYYGLVEPAIV